MALIEGRIETEELPEFGLVVLGALIAIALVRAFTLSRPERGGYRGQLGLFLFIVVALLAILVTLPLEATILGQVIGLVGIVLSAAVALSSTTFLGNLIAGGMLRTVRHFSPGDWIRVGEHFGRVTERGLLHVEIQTQDRDLTTLPNLLLATQPVTVVRRSGTIIAVSVGLGYDVPHARAENALIRAAAAAGLADAFVAFDELGDFTVTYRVAGFLAEVEELLSRRSRLRRCVLDALHEDGIEIMSPSFMNVLQRKGGDPVIPAETGGAREAEKSPDSIAFDKADAVKEVEVKRATAAEMTAKVAEIDEQIKGLKGDEKDQLEQEKARIQGEAKAIADEVTDLEGKIPED